MSTIFQKEVNGRQYCFEQVLYPSELIYRISFEDDGITTSFHMKKDVNNKWKLQANDLPEDIWNEEESLTEAIEYNLANNS